MKTRHLHIYSRETWSIEILDAAKLRTAWQSHCRQVGLQVSQDDYLAGLVLQVIADGFAANNPEITGVVLRSAERTEQIVHT